VRSWVFVVTLIACATGCKRKLDLDGRLDELVQIRNDACSCENAECAQYQQTAFTAWNFRNDSTDAAKMTISQRERFSTLHHDLQECFSKFAPGHHGSGS
jgi:hypothetical protein